MKAEIPFLTSIMSVLFALGTLHVSAADDWTVLFKGNRAGFMTQSTGHVAFQHHGEGHRHSITNNVV